MAVLVTGGAGYIGSHMVLELLDAGEAVAVLDDLSTGFRWSVPDGVPLVVADMGDEAAVDEKMKCLTPFRTAASMRARDFTVLLR